MGVGVRVLVEKIGDGELDGVGCGTVGWCGEQGGKGGDRDTRDGSVMARPVKERVLEFR